MIRESFRNVLSAALLLLVSVAPISVLADPNPPDVGIIEARPRMFISSTPREGLRTVEDLRAAIQHEGHAKALWERLAAKVEDEAQQAPWTPATPLPGRSKAHVERGNREFTLVAMTGNRIVDAALVALITDDRRYADAALKQIMVLFDAQAWPDWRDISHIQSGFNADLRTGQLVASVGIAYDWLYHLMTPEERAQIVAGLERCAIQPYRAGTAAEERWTRNFNNWMTVIVGGFGIAGMALGDDHPESGWLIEYAQARMEQYPKELGADGSFNESVQYAGSMMNLVRYFMARRYATGGKDDPIARHSLVEFGRWYMYMTLPPGRVVGFGDPSANSPPSTGYLTAVAAATQDPVLQWFYLQYADQMRPSHRELALELIYYDATLTPRSPEALPLGRAYHTEGKLISSRSSWDAEMAVSAVYGKAGREKGHSHADWGQLCIDGYAERLIVDLGSTPGYPNGHYEYYYNFQQWGHNIFVFGENDTGGVPWPEKQREGQIVASEFDNRRGASWTIDLTDVYDDAEQVTRKVVHRLPQIVAVLDSATLRAPQAISMRWHTAAEAAPDAQGRFSFNNGKARLVGRVVRLDGDAEIRLGHHAYKAPYDKNRLGDVYPQRNEPYVEIATRDDRCRILTLFCIQEAGSRHTDWSETESGWTIETAEGPVTISVVGDELVVEPFADRGLPPGK